VFLKPQNGGNMGKSSSVVRLHSGKLESEYSNIEAKVESFFKNFNDLEHRSKERHSKIESILKPSIRNDQIPKDNTFNTFNTQQIYHRKRAKYTNSNSEKTSVNNNSEKASTRNLTSQFSGNF